MGKFTYSLMIHGGCGAVEKFTLEEQQEFLSSLKRILKAGEKALINGMSAIDTVEYCVKMLEDDPLYNAGKGSVLNENGEVEMDASIMDGLTLKAGAIAGVKTIKNPVSAAKLIMNITEHVFLIGGGAEKFCLENGAEQRPPGYFIIDKRLKQLADAKKENLITLDHNSNKPSIDKKGTVGAVARDKSGNLAAATSTGGLVNKKLSRVGDSPIIGAGTYADNQTCAVSCTGKGEDFIITNLAKYISDTIHFKNLNAKEASKIAISYLKEKVNGVGGFIVVDRNGLCSSAYSTPGLIRGWVTEGENIISKLFD